MSTKTATYIRDLTPADIHVDGAIGGPFITLDNVHLRFQTWDQVDAVLDALNAAVRHAQAAAWQQAVA